VAQSYGPDLALVSAGMDIHQSDPLGGMGVTPRGFAAMTRTLMEVAETSCGGKLVLTLEGGYNLGGLRDSVGAILNELTDRSRTEPGSVSVGAQKSILDPVIRKVQEIHAGTWSVIGNTP
jgi:acetoin utilization deacetylase AcuC-like enzyme